MNYRVIYKKYLAEALSFLGFNYYKFYDESNPKIVKYSFVETEEFNNALNDILELKGKYDKLNI